MLCLTAQRERERERNLLNSTPVLPIMALLGPPSIFLAPENFWWRQNLMVPEGICNIYTVYATFLVAPNWLPKKFYFWLRGLKLATLFYNISDD